VAVFASGHEQVSSTNKTDHHDITEILLKVALNTINQTINRLHKKYECLNFIEQFTD
jgi:hypothetical protein